MSARARFALRWRLEVVGSAPSRGHGRWPPQPCQMQLPRTCEFPPAVQAHRHKTHARPGAVKKRRTRTQRTAKRIRKEKLFTQHECHEHAPSCHAAVHAERADVFAHVGVEWRGSGCRPNADQPVARTRPFPKRGDSRGCPRPPLTRRTKTEVLTVGGTVPVEEAQASHEPCAVRPCTAHSYLFVLTRVRLPAQLTTVTSRTWGRTELVCAMVCKYAAGSGTRTFRPA